MQEVLRIGRGLDLPLSVATMAGVITGQRGTGKSSTACVEVEEAHACGVPSAIIDPTGVWWGLRHGKRPTDHVLMGGFRGAQADLPLRAEDGPELARLIARERLNIVLGLRHLRKGQQVRFMAEFCEELYHLNEAPLLVVVDEAHRFAPAVLREGEKGGYGARCLGALIDMVTLGRASGLGIRLVTQRMARLHADVRESCELVTAHRLMGGNDLDMIGKWFLDAYGGAQAEGRELLSQIRELETGRAVVYMPTLGIKGVYKIRVKRSFDSWATPEGTQTVVEPKGRSQIDLGAVQEQLEAAVQEAKDNDPAELRRRIAELERHGMQAGGTLEDVLAALEPDPEKRPKGRAQIVAWARELVAEKTEVPVPEPYWPFSDEEFDKAIYEAEQTLLEAAEGERALEEALEAVRGMSARPRELVRVLQEWNGRRAEGIKALDKVITVGVGNLATHGRPPARRIEPRAVSSTNGTSSGTVSSADGAKLGGPHRKVLTTLAQYGPLSKTRLAMQTGYVATGGGFNNVLGNLRSEGFINRGDPIEVTDLGMQALGPFEDLPTGRELLELWFAHKKVGSPGRRVLEALIEHGELTKEELAGHTGYEPTGGGFNNVLGALRTLQLIRKGQPIALTPEFEESIR